MEYTTLEIIRRLTRFNGDVKTVSVEEWAQEIQECAEEYGWSPRKTLLIARRTLDGTAALWLRSEDDHESLEDLKTELVKWFGGDEEYKCKTAVTKPEPKEEREVIKVPSKVNSAQIDDQQRHVAASASTKKCTKLGAVAQEDYDDVDICWLYEIEEENLTDNLTYLTEDRIDAKTSQCKQTQTEENNGINTRVNYEEKTQNIMKTIKTEYYPKKVTATSVKYNVMTVVMAEYDAKEYHDQKLHCCDNSIHAMLTPKKGPDQIIKMMKKGISIPYDRGKIRYIL